MSVIEVIQGNSDRLDGGQPRDALAPRSGQPRQRSLRFMLACLVLACVLPVWMAAAFLVYQAYQQRRNLMEHRVLETARALTTVVDREFAAMQSSATALATSPSLAAGDMASFQRQAETVLRDSPSGGAIVLTDATGQQLMNTAAPLGEPLPKREFTDVMRKVFAGKPGVSNLVRSPLSGRFFVGVEVPVFRGGRVVYDLILTEPANHFALVFSQQSVPPDWPATILDANRMLVSRNERAEKYVGLPSVLAPAIQATEDADGIVATTNREGIPMFAIFSRSRITGWTVTIGIPKAVMLAGIRQWLWWIIGGAIVLSMLGIALALHLAQRITGSIEALVASALALGNGAPVEIGPLRLAETNEVRQSLMLASQLLQRRTAERERAENDLRENRERLRVTLASIGDAVLTTDISGQVTFLNPVATSLAGWQSGEAEGRPIRDVFRVVDEQTHMPAEDVVARVLKEGHARELANHTALITKDGREIPIEDSAAPILDAAGKITGVVLVFHDVTEKRQKEEQLRRLNRTLKALNNSNQALLHAADESALLEQVCKIVTEDCGYAMVWIGFAEDDPDKAVRPVAHAGFEEGYLETLRITWADNERGRGPTGTAIRTGQPCACRNMLMDPEFGPWRAEAIKRGYASSLVLPLLEDSKAFGAVTIYSREQDAFSADEVKLLMELAADLAYGISTLRVRAAREQAEEALRQHREWLRVTLSSIGDAVLTTDTAGRVTFLNPMAAALTGWQSEEAQGQPYQRVLQIIDEATGGPAQDPMARALKEGRAVALANHTALLAKDGRVIPIEDSAAPILDGTGKVIGVVLVFHDVTERRRAEEALRENRAKLEAALQSMTDAVFISDAEGRFVEFNEAFAKYYRFKSKADFAKTFADFSETLDVLLADGEPVPVDMWVVPRALRGEADTNVEYTLRRKDTGETWVGSYSFGPIRDHNGVIVGSVVAARDVTDRKRAEQALLRSEKLATVGRMAASIAHEINNPLDAVMNLLFIAASTKGLPESARQFLETTDAELKRVAHIARQSLGFYRESNAPMLTSVTAVLDSAVDLLQSKIKAKRAVIAKEWDSEVLVNAVAGELRQVFSNLLSNSLDAVDEQGVIRLRVSRCNHRVRIAVADNGRGISPGARQHIFEPFFTTKGTVGTGLGLWVTKQIVDKHGGTIRVRSSSEGAHRGTLFSVDLPVDVAQAVRSRTAGA